MNSSVVALAKQWRREGKCAKCGRVIAHKLLHLRIRRKLVRGSLVGLVRTDVEFQPWEEGGGEDSSNFYKLLCHYFAHVDAASYFACGDLLKIATLMLDIFLVSR